ncbi:MAG: hypothetical protein CMJ49_02785 [Planctomycetaceae bacterium]|nr:hypothetical protein [Planctomycetaceae bacterium]
MPDILTPSDMHLYRHPAIQTHRPYAFDVDDDGRIWQGCNDGLYSHDPQTAHAQHIRPVALLDKPLLSVLHFHGEVITVHGAADHFTAFNPTTRAAAVHKVPGPNPIIWYGAKAADKLILFDRSDRGALLLYDAPDAKPRRIQNPWDHVGLASGHVIDDATIVMFKAEPAAVVLFDAASESFIDSIDCPIPDTSFTGMLHHDRRLYLADSTGGRLLVLDLNTKSWLDPIPTPDHKDVYGFIGASFQRGPTAYFCLSSYNHRSRIDHRTGKLIIPKDSGLGVDGRPHHFLDRFLVFDAPTRSFDYLTAPAQPDGYPLICYSLNTGDRIFIAGYVMPFDADGHPSGHPGDWLVWQNFSADAEPFDAARLTLPNMPDHIRAHSRSVPRSRGLYLAHDVHTPATTNAEQSAVDYPVADVNQLQRRLDRTDRTTYWRRLADLLAAGTDSDQHRARRVGRFIQQAVYYNPISEPKLDPLADLEAHDTRCGNSVQIALALFNAMSVKARESELQHHTVTEVFYDDAWHIQDSLIFGDTQPLIDDRVPSVEQLRADLYFADAMPQTCFVYHPEALRSADGFAILGYQFGDWGWYPFYSTYLGAEWDCPPTLPLTLPAQRLDDRTLRLRWAPSIRRAGGEIEYQLTLYHDRDLADPIDQITTTTTHHDIKPPPMTMIYYTVRAADDHRQLNPDTWYPHTRANAVLAPKDQYGWFGAI